MKPLTRLLLEFQRSTWVCAMTCAVLTSVGCLPADPVTHPTDEARNKESVQTSESPRQDTRVLSADDATALESSVGESVTVTGVVVSTGSSKAGHQFLNFANRDFYVFCPKDSLREYDGEGPARRFDQQRIKVSGKLERFSGRLQIRVTSPDQIQLADVAADEANHGDATKDKHPDAFGLRAIGRDAWLSPAGLEYRGRDPDGLTRLEHVQRHFQDLPDRDGPHGVFDADGNDALAIIDEAWQKIQRDNLQPQRQGQRDAYEVDMGRRVGYLGGQVGKSKGNPPLRHILIVVGANTKRIITAYPK